MTKARDSSVDVLRGIAIILVVLGHVIRGIIEGSEESRQALTLADRAIYSVHMPVLFYLAGYFTELSLGRSTRREYIASRAPNVLYPYLIWSAVYFLAGAVMVHVTHLNNQVMPGDLVRIGWDPINVLWFLYALLVMQVAAALAANRATLLLVGAVALDIVFSVAGWVETTGIAGKLFVHAPYFFLGFWLAQRRRRRVLPGAHSPALAFVALMILFGVAVTASHFAGVGTPVQAGTIPIGLAGGTALAFLSIMIARHGETLAARVLEQLGRASLGIYLLHVLVLATVPRALRALNLDSIALTLVLGTVIGTGGSYLVFKLLKRARVAKYLSLR